MTVNSTSIPSFSIDATHPLQLKKRWEDDPPPRVLYCPVLAVENLQIVEKKSIQGDKRIVIEDLQATT
jgi:hypothetical protein